MRTKGWIAGLALGMAGCSSSGNGTHGMGRDVGALGQHLVEIRTETTAHDGVISAASDLGAVTDEEVRHHGILDGHAAGMDETLQHMASCEDGMGNSPDTGPMHDELEQMGEESSEHIAHMGSAGNMGDAMAEEAEHQTALDTMLDAMETMQDGMMNGAGWYDCAGPMM